MSNAFIPTRNEALRRLQSFLPGAGRAYAARRNFDLGAGKHVGVSQLSPYLRCRLITEEEVLKAILKAHSPQTADKFIQEVFWRTYWKGWLELRPSVWTSYQNELARDWDDLQTQSGLRVRWEAACRGETGIDCFDAWARELVDTGYLHNHARLWFASIWIFSLELPWRLGADFFLRHLLDGDPASNTLGWRWVAGIQTPSKTYLARSSNISKYTEGRFHPKGQLATEAVALAASPAPEPRVLPPSDTIREGVRTGLLLHEDDLHPIYLLEKLTPSATAVLAPQTGYTPLIAAQKVITFRKSAQVDIVARSAHRLGKVTDVHCAQSIADWVKANNLEQIVTPHAPVGPVAETLSKVAHCCEATISRVQRGYDYRAWPNATRGFFAFKKNLPRLIQAIDDRPAS